MANEKRLIDLNKIRPMDFPSDQMGELVNYLIAHGVTFAADNNVGDKWISVKDRLPEPFTPVLICREKEPGKIIVEQGYKDLGKWWKVYGTRITRVIGWMPMPQPPQGI